MVTLRSDSLTVKAGAESWTVEFVLAAWLTVNVWPATVSVPARASGELLAATEKLTIPLPLPLAPAVTVSHAAFLTAVQPQPAPAVTPTDPVPPPAPNDALCELIE